MAAPARLAKNSGSCLEDVVDALKELLPILLSGSLALLVVAIGLDADKTDLTYALRHPRMLLRAAISINLVVPLLAGLVVLLLPLGHLTKVAIILMAVSPLPPLAPGRALGIGGQKSYVYGIYVAICLLSIVVVPLSVAVVQSLTGAQASIAVATVARTIFFTVLVPLTVGMTIRLLLWPEFAVRAASWVYRSAMLLIVLAFIPVLVAGWPAIRLFIGDGTVAAFCLVIAGALLSGHLLGGPDLCNRAALAMASAIRHPGLALLIANTNMADHKVGAAILLFLLTGIVLAFPYQAWIKRRLRARAQQTPAGRRAAPSLH